MGSVLGGLHHHHVKGWVFTRHSAKLGLNCAPRILKGLGGSNPPRQPIIAKRVISGWVNRYF